MKKDILICLFIAIIFNSKVFGKVYGSYFSPGLQIGLNSNWKPFYSAQITCGLYITDAPVFPGLTIGVKKIKRENEWKKYRYYDVQVTYKSDLTIAGVPGLGFGLIQGEDLPPTLRFKLWTGLFVLGSYEFINFKNDSKHHFGLFGVAPLDAVSFLLNPRL